MKGSSSLCQTSFLFWADRLEFWSPDSQSESLFGAELCWWLTSGSETWGTFWRAIKVCKQVSLVRQINRLNPRPIEKKFSYTTTPDVTDVPINPLFQLFFVYKLITKWHVHWCWKQPKQKCYTWFWSLKKKWNMLVRSQRKLDIGTGCSTRLLHNYEILLHHIHLFSPPCFKIASYVYESQEKWKKNKQIKRGKKISTLKKNLFIDM